LTDIKILGQKVRKIIPFPPDKIIREVQVICEPNSNVIRKMWVREKGASEFEEWVCFCDETGQGGYWGPWGLHG